LVKFTIYRILKVSATTDLTTEWIGFQLKFKEIELSYCRSKVWGW